MPAHRRPRRQRTIRIQLVILLLVPLLSLAGLWGFAASLTLGPAVSEHAISQTNAGIGYPGSTLAIQLQQERALSVAYLGRAGHDGGTLAAQRARTDKALATFRDSALSAKIGGPSARLVRQQLGRVVDQMGQLPAIRTAVDRQGLSRLDAVDRYATLASSPIELFASLAPADDVTVYQSTRDLNNISWAIEFLQREVSLVGVTAGGERLSAQERVVFAQWVGAGRQYLDTGVAGLTGSMRAQLQEVIDSPDYARYRRLEDVILGTQRSQTLAQAVASFREVGTRLVTALGQADLRAGNILGKRSKPIREHAVDQLVLAGGVGLLTVIASIALSMLFGRRLARELRDLQGAARTMALERLPRLVARLRRGERIDAEAEAPPLAHGRTVEIGRVADAFTQAQRVAVESAVGESMLRQGINRVFLNLAWRSQSLLHRQLRMLDVMERRATDPEVLKDLFRLDHLTTRMRRHAEGLVILAGASPSREWSKPARMEDVLRAAVAEVEDYERVDVVTTEQAALTGRVVADVVHMLAELIENAAAFSPPNTEITVRGESVGNGFAIEVVDRGIGIDAPERARLNELLASPPEFDLADSERLGLFVVSRLAARHGIRVVLQMSGYAGTTAIVVLPANLVVGALDAGDGADRPRGAARPDALKPARAPGGTRAERPQVVQMVRPAADDPGHAPAQESRPPLQRRRRMANLAPQLREVREPGAAAGAREEPADGPAGHSAEQSRDLWSSLQGGWSRGRDDGEDL